MLLSPKLIGIKILALFVFLSQTNHAWSQPIIIESHVNWLELSALNAKSQEDLAWYNFTNIDEGFSVKNIEILNYESTPLTLQELEKYSVFTFDTIINVKSWNQITQKQPEIGISFYPLIFNKKRNQVEKVTYLKLAVWGNINKTKSAKLVDFPTDSKLKTGNWYKIKVTQTGIYKLTYEQLLALGLSKPENVRVFNRGGRILSYVNQSTLETDLTESAIYMDKGSDGKFNAGDYILFYAEGPVTWSYNGDFFKNEIHPYSDAIYLFLTSDMGSGKQMATLPSVNQSVNYTSTSYDSYQFHEVELKNLIRSGQIFYGEKLRTGDDLDMPFNFPNIIGSEPVKAVFALGVHTPSDAPTCYFSFETGGKLLYTLSSGSTISDHVFGKRYEKEFTFNATSGVFNVNLKFTGGNSISEGYLDYLCLNARESLKFGNVGQLPFRDKNTLDYNTVEYVIDNSGKTLLVWDITNPTEPAMVSLTQNDHESSFKSVVDTLRQFIAFDGSKYLTPELSGTGLGLVPNQNLHALEVSDMIIVSHPDFLEQANDLADFHRLYDTLSVIVTTPNEIYNEFSNGTPDVSAIRNFMRFLYDKGAQTGILPRYLLLFGDGSYQNRPGTSGNSNYILTYQSNESMIETVSFVSDDFFGILDPGEHVLSGTLDVGVGRFPVRTQEEAWLVVNKVKHYIAPTSLGWWRSQICLIGDNGDNDTHMVQANAICEKVKREHPEYNLNKILFDAFPKYSTPSGDRFPQVTSAIYDQMQQGALIIDYVGHGNPRILAHEEVIDVEDVLNWKNYDKLSVFVTASCEVGRFDDYERTSLGEWMLLSPLGAGIAAFTTTRVVYSDSNNKLNINFFSNVFDAENRLGDVIKLAKNQMGGSSINMRNFTLLGDPALKLMIPDNEVVVSTINNQPVMPEPPTPSELHSGQGELSVAEVEVNITNNQGSDTINALSIANVTGYIVDKNGQVIFKNGTVYPTVYDKEIPLMVLAKDDTVLIQNNVLYKGKASITDGFFKFSFMVPKDINYKTGLGKISLYAVFDSMQALGYSTGFYIGGSNSNTQIDLAGPEIELFMNDTLFKNGGTTNDNPTLLAFLTDESGINTTGNGIGHNISAVLDDQNDSPILLNGYFESDLNLYNKGKVVFPMSDLEQGPHTLLFKAWDVYNNSSEKSIDFTVYTGNELIINNLFNYPNPMSYETNFSLEHNQADENINVTISIYNITGNKVAQISESIENAGFSLPGIPWDGTSFGGSPLPNGFYIYQVELENSKGAKNTSSSKLMILR